MGTTLIINRTTNPLDMQIGNYRTFSSLATVNKDATYSVFVDCNDTYREYRLQAGGTSKSLIVNSDDCIDYKTIIIKEVNGKLDVEREPRVMISEDLMDSTSIFSDYVLVENSEYEEQSKKKSSWRTFWL